jgi:hypothetical protein
MTGRDKTGRFVKGCKPGPGNPQVRRLAEHTAAIRSAITGDDLVAVLHKLRDQALEGDVAAARVLLDRIAGTPRTEREPAIDIDLPEIRSAADIVAAFGAVHQALAAQRINVAEARALVGLLDSQGVAFERNDLELMIRDLKKQVDRERDTGSVIPGGEGYRPDFVKAACNLMNLLGRAGLQGPLRPPAETDPPARHAAHRERLAQLGELVNQVQIDRYLPKSKDTE